MFEESVPMTEENKRQESDLRVHARATAALAAGDEGAALQVLVDLANQGSPCWQVYNDLGAIALMNGDLESAEVMFHEAISCQAPVETHLHLATTLNLVGKHEDALVAVGPVLRTDGTNAAAHALIRETLGKMAQLSPVTWAKLVSDLRYLTPDLRSKLDQFDEAVAENRQLKEQNKLLRQQVQSIRDALVDHRSSPEALSTAWHALRSTGEKEWLDALLDSVEQPVFRGFLMPAFPDESIQVGMVGSSNQTALREGFNFYQTVRKICTGHGAHWNEESHLLDFGTGWGRYARIFVRDFHPDNIFGIDVDPDFVELCKKTFPFGNFSTTPALPPCGLEHNKFDLIVAYSVFSHLSETLANAWIEEFYRLLKPGGFIAITTQGRSLIRVCEEHRKTKEHKHLWHKKLAESFTDAEAAERAYDAGQFLFSATGAGEHRPSENYGEALIPRRYVEMNWTRRLELVEFLDPDPLPQALIVLRKPA